MPGNTQAGMNNVRDLVYDSVANRLFVSQVGNHRVTIYDVATIINGENATSVIGQPNFTFAGFNTTSGGNSHPTGSCL